ncbi:MAG: serine protease [bacterium]
MDIIRGFQKRAALLLLLAAVGCAANAPVSNKFGPHPDGRYDNHSYLVNPARMDLAQVVDSIVTLKTRTIFKAPDGVLVPSEMEGSGVVIGGRFVLTVEHVVAQGKLLVQTPFGIVEPKVEKVEERTFIEWKGEEYPLNLLYTNHSADVVLFELPPEVRPPSYPYSLGDSDDLKVGNFIYVIGNPMNLGVNVREGIVSALTAPRQVSSIDAKGENAFMVSNGLIPGDSGTPVLAIRDGRYELVGLSQGTFIGNTRLGWVIRINVIRNLLRDAEALPNEGWTRVRKTVPVNVNYGGATPQAEYLR